MFMSAIAISLLSLAVDTFAELVIIYHPLKSTDHISLTCESEDDRAALSWNDEVNEPSSTPKDFSTIWPSSTSECAIVGPSGCIVKWAESNTWTVVDSINHPMGPVFDSRWEDFEEYSYPPSNWSYPENITNSSSIVFSVRGSGDIFVARYRGNKKSVYPFIRFTSTDRLKSAIYCDSLKRGFEFTSILQISSYSRGTSKHIRGSSEWQTFILRWSWDSSRGLMRIYKDSNFAMDLSVYEGDRFNFLFVGKGYRIKFHFCEHHDYLKLPTETNHYDFVLPNSNKSVLDKYFLTTEENAKLTTLEFDHKEQSFCVELLVSLCSECKLTIRIVNSKGFEQTIGIISGGRTESTYAGLPAWRVVKLSANISKNYESPIKLEILTNKSGISMLGRWAIDNLRKCASVDVVRSVSSVESFASNIQCQKLSYTENSLVESNTSAVRSILEKLNVTDSPVEPPSVRNITTTTALLYHSVHLDEKMWHKLRYEIKTENSSWTSITGNTTRSQNPEYNETLIDKLSPATLYTVRVVVRVNDTNYLIELESVEHNFTMEQEAHPIIALMPIYPNVDENPWKPNLVWLIISLTIMTPVLVILVVRWRREKIYANLKSLPPVSYTNVEPLPVIETHDDWQIVCNWDNCTHLMELKKFDDYVKRAAENGELESQFKILPRGMVQPCQCGSLPINRSKNRCRNLIAYDQTRVILGEGSLGLGSNYINANYIQGYCKEKAYIATQGPKSDTIVDFWRMIWQEEVRVICMLVNVIENGKIMCEQYWPEIGKTVEYGHIAILNLDQHVYAHYTYRIFQLTTRYETTSRKVRHLQYTGWPEQGVPMYSHSIVEYLNELFATPPGPGPIVVHCSTGGGRTGTVILCDISLRHAAAEGIVDLFAQAKKMYDARANMLDNLQQYVLAHFMPTQCLLLPSTKLLCSDISPQRIDELKKDLPAHMQRLTMFSWKDKVLHQSEPSRLPHPEHMAKMRFPTLMPVGQSLVTLKRYPRYERNSSDYISAVNVDGVRVKKQYIASQLPLPSTLSDCWRLIAEKKVELVIILQSPGPEDLSCIEVIPRETTPLIPVPYIKVEHRMSSNYSEHFTMDELLLTNSSNEQAEMHYITALTCSNWSLVDNAEPPPPEALVALWSVSQSLSRAEVPTLVLCRDGITGCGLYLALNFLLERMAVEQECDVILAVRAIRQSRPEFVNSKAQFEYLYDAAVKFLEGFETYANFT